MHNINHLQLNPTQRYDEFDPQKDENKNTEFIDFIIDGKSLYNMLKKYDMVPVLGWGGEEHQKQILDYLLLKQMHPYLYYRYPILVCPWCGDEECGFISVLIEREADMIIWRDFKLEPDNKTIPIEPFYFEWEKYQKLISKTK